MRWVWVVIPLVLVVSIIGIVGVQESFAEECKPIILDYSITGGEVTEICASQSYSVIVKLEASENGQLIIDIPSNVLASTYRSCTIGAVDYLVLVNGAEVSPVEKIVRGTTIVLTIPFDLGHHEIEIISGIHIMSLPNPYNICGHVHGYDKLYLPPAKQIKLGNFLEFIRCNQGLELIFKSNDNSPACVKSSSIEKLIERGWAIQQSIDSSNISESDVSYTLKAPVSLERHPIENTDFGTKFGTPVVIDLNFQTQFVTNELENQLFYVANVIPDDVILKYIFKQDFGNDGRTNYSIIYLPPDQDVAADESYGFVYGRGGIIISVDYLHLTAEQTDIFVDGLLEQRSGSTSKLIDNKRIFYQNGTIGSTQSELVVYDPVLNLVTRVTSYDYDANILEQIALSMVFG